MSPPTRAASSIAGLSRNATACGSTFRSDRASCVSASSPPQACRRKASRFAGPYPPPRPESRGDRLYRRLHVEISASPLAHPRGFSAYWDGGTHEAEIGFNDCRGYGSDCACRRTPARFDRGQPLSTLTQNSSFSKSSSAMLAVRTACTCCGRPRQERRTDLGRVRRESFLQTCRSRATPSCWSRSCCRCTDEVLPQLDRAIGRP